MTPLLTGLPTLQTHEQFSLDRYDQRRRRSRFETRGAHAAAEATGGISILLKAVGAALLSAKEAAAE